MGHRFLSWLIIEGSRIDAWATCRLVEKMIERVTAHYAEHRDFDPPSTMQRVWRYIDIAKFVSLLDTHALFFARADRVSDAWEGAYTVENVRRRPDVFGCVEQNGESSETLPCLSAFHRSMVLHTFLNCWHLSEIESAGMWQLYASRDGGIAVQSTFDRLVRSFPNDDDGLFQVHIGTVKYINYLGDHPKAAIRYHLKTGHRE